MNTTDRLNEIVKEMSKLIETNSLLRARLELIENSVKLALTCDEYGKIVWLENIQAVAHNKE